MILIIVIIIIIIIIIIINSAAIIMVFMILMIIMIVLLIIVVLIIMNQQTLMNCNGQSSAVETNNPCEVPVNVIPAPHPVTVASEWMWPMPNESTMTCPSVGWRDNLQDSAPCPYNRSRFLGVCHGMNLVSMWLQQFHRPSPSHHKQVV